MLLDSMSQKCSEDTNKIADIALQTRNIGMNRGLSKSTLATFTELDKMTPAVSGKRFKCTEVANLYLALRVPPEQVR